MPLIRIHGVFAVLVLTVGFVAVVPCVSACEARDLYNKGVELFGDGRFEEAA